MNRNAAVAAVVVLAIFATALGIYLWYYVNSGQEGLRAYSRVGWGMTVGEVREIMGRKEDPPDQRPTTTGEFERSWTFEDGARYTVVFTREGRSVYKEIAPNWCGVTPLLGKYIDE